ncbi:MAG: peptidoglycan-binding protein [Gammaproteobacteria bacterium]|nr:peptidoglycan-binding protein [Gammaproteobacteria bacterium]MDH3560789.1 peptidoglycan-binding protein [Gammaproteobacteria bacterium]
MLTRKKMISIRVIAAGMTLGVLGGASVIAADNEAVALADAGLLPTNARAGECYAKVMVPAEYKTVEEKVVVAEASEKIEVIPAKYEWTEVRVPVQQESEKLVAVPAKLETVKEKVEIEPAHTVWRMGPGANAKIADDQTVLSALALGLPKTAKPSQCFNEFHQPAQYKTETEKLLKTAASEEIITSEPAFEWVEEKVLVKEASEKIVEVPAQYDVITEKVLESPAYTTWKKGRGLNEKVDNATGEIMCLVEVPAKYKTIEKRVLKSPVNIKKVEIPAEYTTVKVKKLVKPAQEKRVAIPAEYQTVEKRMKVSDARLSWIQAGVSGEGKATGKTLCLAEIPAKYQTITKQVVKEKASIKKVEVPATVKTMRMSKLVSPATEKRIPIPAKYEIVPKRTKVSSAKLEWRPVLCETNTTKDLVLQIQRALQKAGFNPGNIDGVIGSATLRAIDSYQRKNNLAHGGLTLQTIEKLGIKIGG